jgi:hypothetical protein
VSRLLATLLCRPSESSLWFRGSALGRLTCGTGGMSSVESTSCERSSWLVADFLRLLRPLNILDMRMRCADEVSLRPSSELRLFSRSKAPSVDLRMSCWRLRLQTTLGPWRLRDWLVQPGCLWCRALSSHSLRDRLRPWQASSVECTGRSMVNCVR